MVVRHDGIPIGYLDARYVNVTGDTITGNLVVNGTTQFDSAVLFNTMVTPATLDPNGRTQFFQAYWKAGTVTEVANATPATWITYTEFTEDQYSQISVEDAITYLQFEESGNTYDGVVFRFKFNAGISPADFTYLAPYIRAAYGASTAGTQTGSFYIYDFNALSWTLIGSTTVDNGSFPGNLETITTTYTSNLANYFNGSNEVYLMFRNTNSQAPADIWLEVDYVKLDWKAKNVIDDSTWIGDFTVGGNLFVDGVFTPKNLIPDDDGIYTLGQWAKKWKNLYVDYANVKNSLVITDTQADTNTDLYSFRINRIATTRQQEMELTAFNTSDLSFMSGFNVNYTSTNSPVLGDQTIYGIWDVTNDGTYNVPSNRVTTAGVFSGTSFGFFENNTPTTVGLGNKSVIIGGSFGSTVQWENGGTDLFTFANDWNLVSAYFAPPNLTFNGPIGVTGAQKKLAFVSGYDGMMTGASKLYFGGVFDESTGITTTGQYINSTENDIFIYAGGTQNVMFNDSLSEFNLNQVNLDFIFRGQTDSGLLTIDGGQNKVGIGTRTPNQYKFQVVGDTKCTGFSGNCVTKTGAYPITTTDDVILCNGTFTVTLPTAINATGKTYHVKNIGTGIITVATTSSQTIDNELTKTINTRYDSMMLVSDNANWWII